jgi:hypothetical protein
MIRLLYFVLAVLATPIKSNMRLEAENAVLRHQLAVLHAGGTRGLRGGEWRRKRQHHARAGADVRDPEAARDPGNRHRRRRRRRSSIRRLRILPLTGRQLLGCAGFMAASGLRIMIAGS